MKRIYIFSAGVALGVAATRRTRRAKRAAAAALKASLTPSAIAADVADAIAELGNAVGSFASDIRQGAANRRAQYRPMVDGVTGSIIMVAPEKSGPYRVDQSGLERAGVDPPRVDHARVDRAQSAVLARGPAAADGRPADRDRRSA